MKKLFNGEKLKFAAMLVALGMMSAADMVCGQTSSNGQAQFFSVDSFANPGGTSNYVPSYTGSFANGVAWSLSGVDANAGDGLPGGLINPYRALNDGYGNTVDTVASGFAPWQNAVVIQDGTGQFQSAYNAWGGWATGGGVDYIGQSAQTYESPVRYTMTFSAPMTELYLYVREIDDGQMSQWSLSPTVIQTSSYALGSVVYDANANVVRDWSNTGEGLDVGSQGIPAWDYYVTGNTTNPSGAGVMKFSDPAGFTSLSWVTELNPNGAQSDGFQIAFATAPVAAVPEPGSAVLLGMAGLVILRRRRSRFSRLG